MIRVLSSVLFAMACGVFLIGYSVNEIVDTQALLDRGRHATGTVLDARVKTSGGRGSERYIEVKIEYTAADGTRHTFRTPGESLPGDTVDVHYDPLNPENAIIGEPPREETVENWYSALGAGALFVVVPPIIGAFHIRSRRAAP